MVSDIDQLLFRTVPCPHCGSNVVDGEWFCPTCGHVLTYDEKVGLGIAERNDKPVTPGHLRHEPYVPEPSGSPLPKVTATLAALALVVGLGWWAGTHGKLPNIAGALPLVGGDTGSVTAPADSKDPAPSPTESSTNPVGVDIPQVSDADPTGGPVVEQPPVDTTEPEIARGTDDQGNPTETVTTQSKKTYTLVHQALTWEEAQAYCQEHGGQLAQPKTAEELQKLMALVADSEMSAAWLGGTRAGEGAFAWLDGTEVDASLFATGEPNNQGGDENCLALLRNSAGCLLYDVPNSFALFYPAGYIGFVMETIAVTAA